MLCHLPCAIGLCTISAVLQVLIFLYSHGNNSVIPLHRKVRYCPASTRQHRCRKGCSICTVHVHVMWDSDWYVTWFWHLQYGEGPRQAEQFLFLVRACEMFVLCV